MNVVCLAIFEKVIIGGLKVNDFLFLVIGDGLEPFLENFAKAQKSSLR